MPAAVPTPSTRPRTLMRGLALVCVTVLAACQPDREEAPAGPAGTVSSAPATEATATDATRSTGPVTPTPLAAPPSPPLLDTRTLEPARIVELGAGQPMVVAELQLPQGWRSLGGVSWNDQTPCAANQMQWGWTALAPDSLSAVEKLSGFSWQVAGREARFNPCPSAPIESARSFLENTALRLRPGARILGYEDWPEAAGQMARSSQGGVRWEAGRLLIGYVQEGIEMHELLKAAVSFTTVQGAVMGGAGIVDTQRAPRGRLDPALSERIGRTIRLNPQWQQAARQRQENNVRQHHGRISRHIDDWHQRQMAAINARGEADRAAIRMRTNQEVAQIYQRIAAHSSATNERMHGRSVDAMREVNAYRGTDGGRVESSIHGGQRVFQNPAQPGQTYSTDDPYHRPGNAVELQRIR